MDQHELSWIIMDHYGSSWMIVDDHGSSWICTSYNGIHVFIGDSKVRFHQKTWFLTPVTRPLVRWSTMSGVASDAWKQLEFKFVFEVSWHSFNNFTLASL